MVTNDRNNAQNSTFFCAFVITKSIVMESYDVLQC